MTNNQNNLPHIFIIDKPKGPTSHDIINQLRRITQIRKIGHAGTLDPLASGVLVVGIGREGTKQLGDIVKHDKEYIATIKLGATSTTDDEEGDKTIIKKDSDIDSDAIRNCLIKFIGDIKQVPPVYSAIKIKGKPAYKRTRSGETLTLAARDVKIDDIQILDYQWPILNLKVTCGPGVYIRSLARDIGNDLKTGGYLSDLRRTRIGNFDIKQAITLEQFEKQFNKFKEEC